MEDATGSAPPGREGTRTGRPSPSSHPLRPPTRDVRLLGCVVALALFGGCVISADARKAPASGAAPAPAVPLSVVFLGDSVTVGAGASTSDEAFPSLVLRRLQDNGFEPDAREVVSAFGGIYTDLIQASTVGNASLVIVELGAHGVIENLTLPPPVYQHAYGVMLDCLLATGARVVVGTVPSLSWTPWDPLYWRAVGISWIIADQAAARGVPVADIWNATRDRPVLVSPDRMHPGDWGHQVIADVYWPAIRWALADPPSVTPTACPYSPAQVAAILR